MHTAWSGNHIHYAERVFTGEQLIGGGELLLPGEVRLGPGETYQSPWVYGGVRRRAGRRWPAGSTATCAPATEHVSADRPVTLNVWEAVYFDHDLDRLVELAERAAAVGVERYVLDDGWFGSRRNDRAGLGDWVVSPDVWPHGLHPLVDRVRELGMQFGLWFEPEMVNPDSDLARAHPEWIMAARGRLAGRVPPPAGAQPRHPGGATSTSRRQILGVLNEYQIDYIKWDHNRDLVEAGTQPDGGRPGVHAQTLAFYRLLDEIKAAHPGLEIESCSSGGARVDLGVLERTDRVWVSDNIDPLRPPAHAALDDPADPAGVHGLAHRVRAAPTPPAGATTSASVPPRRSSATSGIEWDLARATDGRAGRARAPGSRFYKDERGPAAAAATWSGWTASTATLFAYGVVARDRSRAIFAAGSTDSLYPDPPARLKLRGLDPNRRYRVRPAPGRLGPVRPAATPVVGTAGRAVGRTAVPAQGRARHPVPGRGLHRDRTRARRGGLPSSAPRPGGPVPRRRHRRRRLAGQVPAAQGGGRPRREDLGVQELLDGHRRERRLVPQEVTVAGARVGDVGVAGGVDDDVAAPGPGAALVLGHREQQQVLEPHHGEVRPALDRVGRPRPEGARPLGDLEIPPEVGSASGSRV